VVLHYELPGPKCSIRIPERNPTRANQSQRGLSSATELLMQWQMAEVEGLPAGGQSGQFLGPEARTNLVDWRVAAKRRSPHRSKRLEDDRWRTVPCRVLGEQYLGPQQRNSPLLASNCRLLAARSLPVLLGDQDRCICSASAGKNATLSQH
jgi:hypothetical protein